MALKLQTRFLIELICSYDRTSCNDVAQQIPASLDFSVADLKYPQHPTVSSFVSNCTGTLAVLNGVYVVKIHAFVKTEPHFLTREKKSIRNKFSDLSIIYQIHFITPFMHYVELRCKFAVAYSLFSVQ